MLIRYRPYSYECVAAQRSLSRGRDAHRTTAPDGPPPVADAAATYGAVGRIDAMSAVDDTAGVPADIDALERPDPIKPKLRGWLHAGMFPAALISGVALTAFAESTRGRV